MAMRVRDRHCVVDLSRSRSNLELFDATTHVRYVRRRALDTHDLLPTADPPEEVGVTAKQTARSGGTGTSA